MFDLFYIVEVSPKWYQLCIKTNHYCVACGEDISTLLATVKKYVKKYRTAEKFLKALSKTVDRHTFESSNKSLDRSYRDKDVYKGMHYNKKTEDYHKEIFNSATYLYLDEIGRAVSEAIEEVRQDTPFNHIRKLKRTISLPTTPVEKTTTHVEKKVEKKDINHEEVGLPKLLVKKIKLISI